MAPCLGPRASCPGDDSGAADLVEAAVRELATYWSPLGCAEPAAVVSSIGFLVHQAEKLLFDAVADACDRGHSWEEVAKWLFRDAQGVERRYATYAYWRTARAQGG